MKKAYKATLEDFKELSNEQMKKISVDERKCKSRDEFGALGG